MQKPMVWNSTLSLVGLGALLIYILACTSFSPDDSKLLYLTTDAKSGLTAVAVYDRKTLQSETVFDPLTYNTTNASAAQGAIMRPQWINDGHDILAAWTVDSEDKKMSIAVMPFDHRGPTRTFRLANLGNDAGNQFYWWQLPVVGSFLFMTAESNDIIRLDLNTGDIVHHTNQQELIIMPSPDNSHLFYIGGGKGSNMTECGFMNAETFACSPLFKLNNENVALMSMALSQDARFYAYQVDQEKPAVVHLLETGKPIRTLSLASIGTNTAVFIRRFSPDGKIIYGSFKDSTQETNVAYGFLEIPVDGSAIRKNTLINGANGSDKDMFASFQVDISHDGKALAVESLWFALGAESSIKPEDCALFLVDLSDPERKVTKIAIPVPPKERPALIK